MKSHGKNVAERKARLARLSLQAAVRRAQAHQQAIASPSGLTSMQIGVLDKVSKSSSKLSGLRPRGCEFPDHNHVLGGSQYSSSSSQEPSVYQLRGSSAPTLSSSDKSHISVSPVSPDVRQIQATDTDSSTSVTRRQDRSRGGDENRACISEVRTWFV